MPRLVVEERPEVERGRFYVLSANVEAHGHMGKCPGYALHSSQGKATKPRKDEFRERVGMTNDKILTGEARIDTCKDRIAETQRVQERKRVRVEGSAGDMSGEPGNRDDEQVAVRHADASGGYIMENQHEEKRVRDIQVIKRGSEAAIEEQIDKWRKTVRLGQEAPSVSASSDPYVALRYPASCETQRRLGSALVQKSGHVGDDVQISALALVVDGNSKKSSIPCDTALGTTLCELRSAHATALC